MSDNVVTRHESLWLATASASSYPTLDHDLRTEVAVVGGGMVGVLCANLLRRAGRKVTLLEARRVLGGVTGNTTAKVTASHGPIYRHLADEFGRTAATLYAGANNDAIGWIESAGVECDFRRKPLYLYAESSEGREQVRREAQAASDAGLECATVDALDVPFEHHGAVLFPNQAEFHPLRFLLPFLEGLEVYEGTPVKEVDEGRMVTLTTREGRTVVADFVVIATHFPFFDPAFYYARLNPFRDYAIAVRLDSPPPEAMYVGIGEGYTYRTQPSSEGELMVVSGGGHKVGKEEETERFYEDMIRHTRQHFSVADIPYRWSSQDVETLDKVPYVGRISANSERVFVATGFGGWGMTNSVVSARLIADLISGVDNPVAELFSPSRFKPLASAPALGTIVKDSVQGLVGERLAGASHRQIADIAPGEGDLLQTDEGKLAVYRDESGRVHAVSPVCTHMGCILQWNSAERSWDCPCHGSRFDPDGLVLHGPAVEDLEAKAIPDEPQ